MYTNGMVGAAACAGLLLNLLLAPLLAQPALERKDGVPGDAGAAYGAMQEALDAYRPEASEANYIAFLEAGHGFLEHHAEDERARTVRLLIMQVMTIHRDWDGLREFAEQLEEEAVEDEDPSFYLALLHSLGVASANLGERQTAEEMLERLRNVETDDRGLQGQARRSAREVAHHIRFMPGSEAPAFELPVIDGEERHSLDDFAGAYTLLVFNTTHCPDCQRLMDQELKPIWNAYRDERFDVVSIGLDDAASQREVAEQYGFDWTSLYDPERRIMRSYGVRGNPYLALIDPEGRFIGVAAGDRLLPLVRSTLVEAFPDIDAPWQQTDDDDDDDDKENAEQD